MVPYPIGAPVIKKTALFSRSRPGETRLKTTHFLRKRKTSDETTMKLRRINLNTEYETQWTPAQEAAFDRCVDYLTGLIEKYGAILKEELQKEQEEALAEPADAVSAEE